MIRFLKSMNKMATIAYLFLSQFHRVSKIDMEKIIRKPNTMSFELDPIPTFPLKQYLFKLLLVVIKKVNLSLEEQLFLLNMRKP